jgi:hypothetical protein
MPDDTAASVRERQSEAARALADATLEALADDRGVHAETAVAGAARMAGVFLLRSFGLPLPDLEPGQVLLSDLANEAGPGLLALLTGALAGAGVALDSARMAEDPGPEHAPLLDHRETQRRLAPRYARIQGRLALSDREAAESAVLATALLIQRAAGALDPGIASALAAQGLVEGSKTVPEPAQPWP